ncbi:MAG TPA: hypothetical protein VLF91_02750 [Candidatus Saccharimonadales bacterium]|nr:hypothetical protein [Candidatus Saccharimonadales bacterium]
MGMLILWVYLAGVAGSLVYQTHRTGRRYIAFLEDGRQHIVTKDWNALGYEDQRIYNNDPQQYWEHRCTGWLISHSFGVFVKSVLWPVVLPVFGGIVAVGMFFGRIFRHGMRRELSQRELKKQLAAREAELANIAENEGLNKPPLAASAGN